MGIRLIVLILLLIIAAPALASVTPDTVLIQSDTEWLIAGSTAYATLTATVSTGSSPLPNIPVTFSLDDPAMGTLSAASISTNDQGKATVRFTPSTRSGGARIRVSAGSDPMEEVFIQNIDHGVPKTITNLRYPHEAMVGSTVMISLTLNDQYGNPVNDLHESVTLTANSAGGGSAFPATGSRTITVPVASDGSVSTKFTLDTYPGEHIISIDPSPQGIAGTWISITALAHAYPDVIACTAIPDGNPSTLPADGLSSFEIRYAFYDAYGNRAGNQEIRFIATTDAGIEEHTIKTSSLGEIHINYGPSVTIGTVRITCSPVKKPYLIHTLDLEFVSNEPTAMLLTANPQMIASHDVDSEIKSEIRAKVIDDKGNPVSGEIVSFELLSIDSDEYVMTVQPHLETITGITDQNGIAIARFTPGAFITDQTAEGYTTAATGKATIHAIWRDQVDTVAITWKNYPYLSISSVVEPEKVSVNEIVNVTIKITGDGWALRPDPIDAVLCIDRSGSMFFDYPDRMVWTMDAAVAFNQALADGDDRVGLVSFGTKGLAIVDPGHYYYSAWAGVDGAATTDWEEYAAQYYPGSPWSYNDHATLDVPLTDERATVDTAIRSLVPNGGTPMRAGLYQAIHELVTNGRPDAVRAVVLLGDGDYNWYGDPLARGPSSSYPTSSSRFYDLTPYHYHIPGLSDAHQNLSVYASDHNITIYSIAFSDDITEAGQTTLQILAESTGGKYYYAPTGGDLASIYADIAGELSTEAGVNTALRLSHESVLINNEMIAGGGPDGAFTYIPKTMVRSWRNDEVIIPEYFVDQSQEWHGSPAPLYSLVFDVGTIHLNQVWEVRYSLMARKGGNINIFNSNSMVTFENAPDEGLGIPTTYLTVIPSMEVAGLQNHPLKIINLRPTSPGHISTTLPVTWDLEYSGSGEVTQQIWYAVVDPMIHATLGFNGPYQWELSGIEDGSARKTTLGVAGKNGLCLIRIDASAPGSPDDRAEIAVPIGTASGQAYIKIE
ncbi:hypothetical protein J2T58_000068 [Methanocalculus alkaliphilus]|uniref:Ig-like domain-containing protein n=1 Tax=Methanocalculus alkaliphilus TaxID=768730 RepID=UPI00209DF3EA|nr:VWA domain-containing protein [Methanocalculus alkaliphilus]MCP1714241.1 hypothetical protein [Methanocalculus alkaliphilus]